MAHVHGHRPAAQRGLGATLVVTLTIMFAEAVGGWLSGSLALLADAGHMLTDVLALMVAFAAVSLSSRPADARRTYGYRRLEILAALANGVLLVVLSGSIVYEAVQRWMEPREVQSGVMAVVAAVGFAGNAAGLLLLRGERGNLNVHGAFLHVLGDTLSSVGVLVAAAVIAVTGWMRIDALISLAIAAVIVVTSLALLREVFEVLLEAVPRGMHAESVRRTISGVYGVADVHDLHVWSITSGMPALSAHVVLEESAANWHVVLLAIQERLRAEHDIDHSTLQLEPHGESGGCCWDEDERHG